MTSVRRTAGGAVDTEFYVRRARRMRNRVLGLLWVRLRVVVSNAFSRATRGKWTAHGIRRWLRFEH